MTEDRGLAPVWSEWGRLTRFLESARLAFARERTLWASLAETAAVQRLGGDARDYGRIEDWGKRLLATTGSTWGSLKDGVAGAVEVAVVRNAYGGSSSTMTS